MGDGYYENACWFNSVNDPKREFRHQTFAMMFVDGGELCWIASDAAVRFIHRFFEAQRRSLAPLHVPIKGCVKIDPRFWKQVNG